ncbi:MAG: ABC transporter permease subunit [Desulfobacteraceae bacterium]|nr:MAG: ABC transporter permease subunit [Desulfobacteraceae bacterium]
MTKFIIKRLLSIFPTLLIVITICFFLVRMAPGGPFDLEKTLPKVIQDNMKKKYHMDEPLWKQYGRYVTDLVFKLDFGPSYRYQDHDVSYYIGKSLPNSAMLGIIALSLAVFLGVGVGIISALKQNTLADYIPMSIAVIGISVPNFVVGPVLMYYLALKWQWLPTSGWIMEGGPKTIIMPAITLSLVFFAYIARLSRSSLLEVLRSDYIRTARAKGLSGRVVIFKHALKGAMLPVVSYLGPAFSFIITGSVVVESIFRVPGLAKFFVQSALNRDYTLLLGALIIYSSILMVANFVVDVAYSFIDPRISYK